MFNSGVCAVAVQRIFRSHFPPFCICVTLDPYQPATPSPRCNVIALAIP